MNRVERLARWWGDRFKDDSCPYCKAQGDCHPACPTRVCPECGGLGAVIDLANPLGVDMDDGEVVYGGKPCPRGCEVP